MKHELDYNDLISDIELQSIELSELQVKRYRPEKHNERVNVEYGITGLNFESSNQNLIINVTFNLESTLDNSDKTQLFHLTFTYSLNYTLSSYFVEDFSKDFIEMFMEINVPINVWPYARELVSSMTVRMGFPALVISTYKQIPKDTSESDENDD